ncbi:ComEC/Rec2 family competence protein [Candidatus Roizmanbacteria bacterium]|nr:ComEC/Rec2 family competence protein [Candidatus Roizmanbacteria bacterium]
MPDPSIFTSLINSYLPEPHASLLNGILFGVNLKAGKIFYQELKIVGLLHLVVLSGMNITILASITGSLTQFFSKRTSILITILVIILFILFVGIQAPIIRAGFMGILTLVAIVYGRKNIAIYALLLSLIFIAVFWPRWLTTISLQLSYGATLGIILFGQTTSKNELWRELKTSLAAQVFTVPIIFIYFRQVSLVAPISNLLVAFTIYPLMIFGFATAILGKIHYLFGLIPSFVCYGLLQYMIFVIEKLSKLPFIFFDFSR